MMILLAVGLVASGAGSLFGLAVIGGVNLLLCCPAWAQTASTFYRNTCFTMSSRRVECVKLRSSVMMPPVIVITSFIIHYLGWQVSNRFWGSLIRDPAVSSA